MGTVFVALAWILAAGLILLLLLLSIPLYLTVELIAGPQPTASAEIRLLAGLMPAIRMVARPRAGAPGAKLGVKLGAKRPALAGRRRLGGWRLLRGAARFVERLLRRVHLDRVEIEGRLGLGDPADTGTLFGWLLPLAQVLPAPRFRIALEPDFTAATLSGRASAILRLTPITFLPPLTGLALAMLEARR